MYIYIYIYIHISDRIDRIDMIDMIPSVVIKHGKLGNPMEVEVSGWEKHPSMVDFPARHV